jgi:hypothetical protein
MSQPRWIPNILTVATLKYKLNNGNTLKLTEERISAYIKSKHPHLPEESIKRIIDAEIEDVKKIINSNEFTVSLLKFSSREPFIDKLIRVEVNALLAFL